MIAFILLIAVTNLGLGYVVGLTVGRGGQLPNFPSPPWKFILDRIAARRAMAEQADLLGLEPQPVEAAAAPLQASDEEISLFEMLQHSQHFIQQLSTVDRAVRGTMGEPNIDSIVAATKQWRTAVEEYLQTSEQSLRVITEKPDPRLPAAAHEAVLTEGSGLEDLLRAALTILGNEGFSDATSTRDSRRLLAEVARQATDAHKLRDVIEQAVHQLAQRKRRAGDLPAKVEASQEPISRVAFDTVVAHSWPKKPEESLAIGMIDFDHLAELNRRLGLVAVDRLLPAAASLLARSMTSEGFVARHGGQQMLLVMPGRSLHEAAHDVEVLRQTLEQARFDIMGVEIELTMSGAVAGVTDSESWDDLLTRTSAALRESKQYGRNRTFLHEGGAPSPVAPPKLTLEPEKITLT